MFLINDFQHPDEDDELDNPDDLSTDEEETVTEVAVSEKTLKFKISTESTRLVFKLKYFYMLIANSNITICP